MSLMHALVPSVLALALASCASQKADQYDTANPYGTADASAVNPPAAPQNPIYDTPAAYDASTASPDAAAAVPGVPTPIAPNSAAASLAPTPIAPANGPAIIHTVVPGDTLSGLSAKYKIPSASIKLANRMTTDTVVLGRKMVIPPN